MRSKSLTIWAIAMAVLLVWATFINAGEVVWTGLGADDRWSNTDNWQGGVLPTENDDIAFADIDWWNPGSRHASVTIDATARARDLDFFNYGNARPFANMTILPGADYSLSNERIDQGESGHLYHQSGGTHVVTGDFSYTTWKGDFSMTGGIFEVGGTFNAGQEHGDFSISGGQLQATNFQIGGPYAPSSFSIGSNAQVTVTNELTIHKTDYEQFETGTIFSFDSPIIMHGADFVNELEEYWDPHTGFNSMSLVFDGGLTDISTFEVGGGDYGPDVTAFVGDNYAIDTLQVGDIDGLELGYVLLLDTIDNYSSISGNEALYVNNLILGSGSYLDLNGLNLYCLNLVDYGATIDLNGGQLHVIPEPCTLLLLGLGAVMFRKKRSF